MSYYTEKEMQEIQAFLIESKNLGKYVEEKPIVVTAANGVSRYTTKKIARDHDLFKSVLAKHYHSTDSSGKKRPPKFKWAKVFTKLFVAHHFKHDNPRAAHVIIKRRHTHTGPEYRVHVRIPHLINGKVQYTAKGNIKHIYNRKFVTKNPAKHLDRMLGEARWSQHTGKQFRRKKPLITSSSHSTVTAKPLSTEERNALPDSAFVFPVKRKYPIHDKSHAIDALSRASAQGGKVKEAVFRAVYKKYPELKHHES